MAVEVRPLVVGDDRVAEQRARRVGCRLQVDELEVGQAVARPPRRDRLGADGRPAAVGVADLGEEQPQVAVGADLGVERPEPLLELGLDPRSDPRRARPARRRQELEAVAGLDEGGVVGEAVVAQVVVGADEGVLEQPQGATVRQGVGVRVVRPGQAGGVVGAEEGVEAGRRRRGGARRGRGRRRGEGATTCRVPRWRRRSSARSRPALCQAGASQARPTRVFERTGVPDVGNPALPHSRAANTRVGVASPAGLGQPGDAMSARPPAVELRRARRDAIVAEGRLRYPETLPITARRDELLAAIGDHQVVIVAGETGSGKSTQLPKLCLELGRGVDGLIGHTQPRRVAARTVAERVADELGSAIGDDVGYSVRFNDRVGDGTLVRVMTDGILLAELQRDRMLRRYDTLIVDEAHERSLNIDFILGYLRQLLPRRPDLKVIVTSATIDTERFARHFGVGDGAAPIVAVTGRTYPVEVRYRPFGTAPDDDRDQVQAIVDAIDELPRDGDVLVFLSGEREIHDTADALRRRATPGIDVLPLYARLSSAEQHRIFQSHPGRRIVLATNVAETSITVPGVRNVVDAGTARISRYSRRLKVQRLPIEPISRASADQRAGRCGRVAAGICIRLYAEDDYLARDEFTEPEILRTNLASVILQMTAIGLGDVASFPFVEPPDAGSIRDGYLLLEELGAIGAAGGGGTPRLTPIGRRLARLPVDPRLGRMILEAERHGCVREVLVIAAALSIQDPRERPSEQRDEADDAAPPLRRARQ